MQTVNVSVLLGLLNFKPESLNTETVDCSQYVSASNYKLLNVLFRVNNCMSHEIILTYICLKNMHYVMECFQMSRIALGLFYYLFFTTLDLQSNTVLNQSLKCYKNKYISCYFPGLFVQTLSEIQNGIYSVIQ